MTDAPSPAPAPAAPVTVAGEFVYADVPNRAIAYIIDAIILAITLVVVGLVLAVVGVVAGSFVSATAMLVIGLVVSAVYFIYSWTRRRATFGMSAHGMQIGNAVDGATLTQDQAIRRWLAISAPSIAAQALQPIPTIGNVVGLMAFAWFIFLVYTTAQSPTKQGWHDTFVNSMVVKAAKKVA
jgi:uncharacterized RDD family membrane protein YckC